MAKAVLDLSGGLDDIIAKGVQLIEKTRDGVIDVIRTEYYKYLKEVKEQLEYACRTSVDTFYESYPKLKELSYDRLGDLYNAFEVVVDEKKQGVHMDSSLMQYEHHQDNEYIYENSFMRGYHGGSIGTDQNGITQSEPWYRTPPAWERWYYRAAKSKSPYQMIKERAELRIDEEWEKLRGNISKNIKPYMDALNDIHG